MSETIRESEFIKCSQEEAMVILCGEYRHAAMHCCAEFFRVREVNPVGVRMDAKMAIIRVGLTNGHFYDVEVPASVARLAVQHQRLNEDEREECKPLAWDRLERVANACFN